MQGIQGYLHPPPDWTDAVATLQHGWRLTLSIKFGRSAYQTIIDARVRTQDLLAAESEDTEQAEPTEPAQASIYIDALDTDGSVLDLSRQLYGHAAEKILDHRGRDGLPPRAGQVQLCCYDKRDRVMTTIARTLRREEFLDDMDLDHEGIPRHDESDAEEQQERINAARLVHATNKLLSDFCQRTMSQNQGLVGLTLRNETAMRDHTIGFTAGIMELTKTAAGIQAAAMLDMAEAERAKSAAGFWVSPVGEAVGSQIGEIIGIGLEFLKLMIDAKSKGA